MKKSENILLNNFYIFSQLYEGNGFSLVQIEKIFKNTVINIFYAVLSVFNKIKAKKKFPCYIRIKELIVLS